MTRVHCTVLHMHVIFLSIHLLRFPPFEIERHAFCTPLYFGNGILSKVKEKRKSPPKKSVSSSKIFNANSLLIEKQVYIFQCKLIVNKKTGLHFSIHFNWCAPSGKIENMHWQCRSPKGTLHCSNTYEIRLTCIANAGPYRDTAFS
jgi:hypothetical protein